MEIDHQAKLVILEELFYIWQNFFNIFNYILKVLWIIGIKSRIQCFNIFSNLDFRSILTLITIEFGDYFLNECFNFSVKLCQLISLIMLFNHRLNESLSFLVSEHSLLNIHGALICLYWVLLGDWSFSAIFYWLRLHLQFLWIKVIHLIPDTDKSCTLWKIFQLLCSYVSASRPQTTQHCLNSVLNWAFIWDFHCFPLSCPITCNTSMVLIHCRFAWHSIKYLEFLSFPINNDFSWAFIMPSKHWSTHHKICSCTKSLSDISWDCDSSIWDNSAINTMSCIWAFENTWELWHADTCL